MILPIYTFGQPVLRKVAEDIDKDYPNLTQIIQDMYETLDRSEGIGLAAPASRVVTTFVTLSSSIFTSHMIYYFHNIWNHLFLS